MNSCPKTQSSRDGFVGCSTTSAAGEKWWNGIGQNSRNWISYIAFSKTVFGSSPRGRKRVRKESALSIQHIRAVQFHTSRFLHHGLSQEGFARRSSNLQFVPTPAHVVRWFLFISVSPGCALWLRADFVALARWDNRPDTHQNICLLQCKSLFCSPYTHSLI